MKSSTPNLVVEILSPGPPNEERDLDLKLTLYSRRGVREYWIVDWREVSIRVYRRADAALQLVATLSADDALTSPMLPGFSQRAGDLCAAPI
jgi:Uma2 family endonuclease